MSFRIVQQRLMAPWALLLVAAMLLAGTGVTSAQGTSDVAAEPLTVLFLGVNAPAGQPVDGVPSDLMTVLHLDPETSACRMLSIPKDTRVEIEGIGQTKINHALMEGGVPLATETVEKFLGIEIDNYGLMNLGAAVEMIDSVGGITITNETAFSVGTNDFPAGEIHLNGAQAVLYARYMDEETGDFGRIERQQVLFTSLLRELQNAPTTDVVQGAFGSFGTDMETDLTADELVALGSSYARDCTSETLVTDTVPASEQGMLFDDLLQQEAWFVTTDPAVVQEKADALMGK